MSSPNPFAPPLAQVRDIEPAQQFQEPRIFAVDGRIGRLRLLAYTMGASLLVAFFGGIVAAGVGAAANSATLIAVVMFLIYGGTLVLNFMFIIQRSHDMDLSGWFSILALIPFVGLYWVFKGGTPGPNRFGAPPTPNTLGVKILAWILPAIAAIGILAAIALPAYVNYQARAKAVQMK